MRHAQAPGWRIVECQASGDARFVAEENARRVVHEVASGDPDAVFVIGGDTAFAVIAALGQPILNPLGEVVAGVAMTRIGYLQWRKRLYKFHADVAAGILRDVGYDDETIGKVASLLKKENLKANPDAQALEDVIGLVFLESYLGDFVATHRDYESAKLADILRKTAKKMSIRGRAAALELIHVPSELAPVVREAMSADASGGA